MKFVLFLLVLLAPLSAQAFCQEPSFTTVMPRPPMKPVLPICVMLRSCDQWEIDRYEMDLENYVTALKRYVREAQEAANQYAEDALAYAKCQLKSI